MALDKQKILSELGSVMNQLQSADCGCLGKLFSNQNDGQNTSAMANHPQSSGFGGFGGCGHGCCHNHGGFNMGHGEPHASNGPCMGQCNPRKIYADTYNYLNQNLMQPTVKEVYDDLKSITPENTVMNNAMASKMGMSPQGGNQNRAGNLMEGGNFMQGENAQYVSHVDEGTPNGKMDMQHNQMMASNMGNHMQGNMHGNINMLQNQMQDNGLGYEMHESMQGGAGMPVHQMQENAMGYQMQETPQNNSGMPQSQMHGNSMGNNMDMSMNNNQDQRMAQMMGGMGPQIVNMMKSLSAGKPVSTPQGGQMPGTMLIDAPQSPHGAVGVTPLNTAGEMNQGQYDPNTRITNNSNQQMYTPTTQYVTDSNMLSEFNPNVQTNMTSGFNPNTQTNMTSGFNPNVQNNISSGFNSNANNNYHTTNANMQQRLPNSGGIQNDSNPATKQMSMANRNYGQHTQGMKKFNEMFPGVMGGDLGFDPMALAIQMNPKNHQMAAMDTMQKMMSGNKGNMNTVMANANAAAANLNQGYTPPANQQQNSQQAPYGQLGAAATPVAQIQQPGGNINTSMISGQPNEIPQQQLQNSYNGNQIQQNEMYEVNQQAVPTMSQGQTQQQIPAQKPTYHYQQQQMPAQQQLYQYQQQQVPAQQQEYQYQQQQINSNTEVVPQTTPNQESGDNNALIQQQVTPEMDQMMIKDPIFPTDTSRFQPPPHMRRPRYHQYNTLGQPVELLPARLFQNNTDPNLPQTLSPQPETGKQRKDIDRFNVKSTVSKTSLMANRPVGRTPSRSQLQNIYNQYKGSHSLTQQHVRAAEQGGSYSEGKIVQRGNINQMQKLPVPVERVGGDTTANNQAIHNQVPVKEPPIQQFGDARETNKPHGDIMQAKDIPVKLANCRNGLQDMTYSTYPTSAASWTFHGNLEHRAPYSSRYRNKA